MSASKVEPKVLKKQIQSKIDSGISRRPSTLTLTPKSRQPSVISRASSSKSNSKGTNRKPMNDNTSPRPNTSFTSTRISHPSKLNHDRVQKGVHKLGQLPTYLRTGQRPATASSKLRPTESETKRKPEVAKEDGAVAKRVLEVHSVRYKKFQDALPAKYGQYATNKNMLDGLEQKSVPQTPTAGKEPNVASATRPSALEQAVAKICAETDQIEPCGCPPCEGYRSGDTAALQGAHVAGKHMELEELYEKMRQVQEKCEQHELECRVKQERIVALESALADKCETIEKLQNHVDDAKQTSKSRETIAQNAVKELEQQLADVRMELVQKCNELTRSETKVYVLSARVDELTKNLAGLRDDVEEKDKRIFELTEKEVEFDELNQRCKDLAEQLIMAKQESATKEVQRVETQKEDPIKNDLLAELETTRTELVSLQKENEKLRHENAMITNAKKEEDVLAEIRKKLLDNIERSKETFKARCEEMSSYEGDVEAEKDHTRTKDILFQCLAQKQRRCNREEQIISEIDQNNRRCRAARNSLLHMVKRFKKENRQMREIMMKCGPQALMEPFEEPTREDNSLKSEIVQRMYQLFPEEPIRELVDETHLDDEEEFTGRIVYDDKILSRSQMANEAHSS